MQKKKENLNGVESSMVQCYMEKDEKIDATRKKRSFLMSMKKCTVTWLVSMVAIYLADDNEN